MNPQVRVFLSSTFSDFRAEREAIQKIAMPRLRQAFDALGARYDLVDLRWGITEEAQKSHETIQICLEEIRRCQRLSPKPNFAILLGDRYGWQPLPAEIPEEHWRAIFTQASWRERRLLKRRYRGPDLNCIPPVYRLIENTEGNTGPENGDTQLQHTLRYLADKAGLKGRDRLPYFASATHQEIAVGALDPTIEDEAASHVRCYIRRLEGDFYAPEMHEYIDWNEQSKTPDAYALRESRRLQETLLRKLGESALRRYDEKLRDGKLTKEYRDQFISDFIADQIEVGEAQLKSKRAETSIEIYAGKTNDFEEQLCKNFRGRQEIIQFISDYLEQDSPGSCCFVVGPGGSGKSTLIAMAARLCRQSTSQDRVSSKPIVYYIGGISGSESLESVLSSLEIKINLRKKSIEIGSEPNHSGGPGERLKICLEQASQNGPLILMLDGLDQLDLRGELALMKWLPATLPKNVHLIASCRTDSTVYEGLSILFPDSLLRVPEVSESDASEIFHAWLEDPQEIYSSAGLSPLKRRTITPSQEKKVLEAFSGCGRILWLRLIAEQAKRWPSWYRIDKLPNNLERTISWILFESLIKEGRHPKAFLIAATSFLAAARYGLSDAEINRCLALHDDVRSELDEANKRTGQSWNDESSLPPILWSRLLFDLKPFLTLLIQDGTLIYRWFHREFATVLTDRLHANNRQRVAIHRDLATMFKDQAEHNSLLLEKISSQGPTSSMALRRVMEQPFHMFSSGQIQGLVELLESIDFCMAKCGANKPLELVEDTKLIPREHRLSDAQYEWFLCLRRWSRRLALGDNDWPSHRILIQLCLESKNLYEKVQRKQYQHFIRQTVYSLRPVSYVTPLTKEVELETALALLLKDLEKLEESLPLEILNSRWLCHSREDGSMDLYDIEVGKLVDTYTNESLMLERIISSDSRCIRKEVIPPSEDSKRVVTRYGSSIWVGDVDITLGSEKVMCCGEASPLSLYLCGNILHLIDLEEVARRSLKGAYLHDGSRLDGLEETRRDYKRFDIVAFTSNDTFASIGWQDTTYRDEIKIEVFKISDQDVQLKAAILCNDSLDLPFGLIGVLEDGRMVLTAETFHRSYCFDPNKAEGEICLCLDPLRWSYKPLEGEQANPINYYSPDSDRTVKVEVAASGYNDPSLTGPLGSFDVPCFSLDCYEGSALLWAGHEECGDHDGLMFWHVPEGSNGLHGLIPWVSDVPIRFVIRINHDHYLVIKDSGPVLLKIPSEVDVIR